jgi:hypothetical protein
MNSTRREEIVKPRPVTPKIRVIEASAWVKAIKDGMLFIGRNSNSGIRDSEMQ